MIDIKNKVLFIHIPRTNGSEFCNQYYNTMLHEHIDERLYDVYIVGNGSAHKHFTATEYKAYYFGEDVDNYKQICITRNIFDLVVSTFFQHIHINHNGPAYENWLKKENRQFSLDSWIDYLYMLREQGTGLHINKSPYDSLLQSRFLVGCVEACTLISYEDYETQIMSWFENNFQKTVKIPIYNDKQLTDQYAGVYRGISRPVDYREMYTDSSIQKVSDLFADEISIFNFKFDG